jgi:hypothetical protein
VFGTGMRLQGGTGTTPTVFYLNSTGSSTTTSIVQFVNNGHQIVCTDSNTYAGIPSIGSGHNIYYMSGGHNFSGNATFRDNVGIGTSNPTFKLDVNGFARVKSTNAIRGSGSTQYNMFSIETSEASPLALNFNIVPSTTTSQQGIHIHTVSPGVSDDHNLILQSDLGRVGIGNKYPSYMLDVNGQARFTGNYTTSDAREKKNIELVDTQNSESIVRQLQVKSYNWLTEDTSNVAPHIGWIAQDVQAIVPGVVSTDNQGKLSISYGDIQAHMCGALQQALEKIDSLQAQNADLLERLSRLESLLAA